MQNPYDRRQPTYIIPAPLSQPRRSTWKNPCLIGCFSLIAILVLSVSLLYWFAFRPLMALYFPPGNGYTSSAVAFSPDGHILAVAEFKYGELTQNQNQATEPRLVHIDLWDVSSSVKLHTLAGSDPIAFSPDGHTLATGSQDNHSILLWNVSSGTLQHTIASHNQISSLVFSPDGQTLASSSQDDHFITLWDGAHGTILRTLSGHTAGIVSLAYSPDGSQLASGSLDQTIKLWDVASGKVLHTLPNSGDGGLNPVQFSPDGHTLASAGQIIDNLIIWDLPSGKQQQSFSIVCFDCNFPMGIAFSPDGHTLVSGSENGDVEIWDPASGQLLRTLV